MTARAVALRALREWRRQDRFADAIMHDILAKTSLREIDRAFARELFYGVLRNLTLLDFWISRLRKGKLDADSRDLIRLGLLQLLLLRTAGHAAINETVALAQNKNRGLINAVLREAQRREQQLRAEIEAEPLAVRFSHPDFLIARWRKNLGTKNTVALLEFNNRPAPVFARINRLKTDSAKFFAEYPSCSPLPNQSDFFEAAQLPGDALSQGTIYVQDPATIVACELLDPQPGDRGLDACAAPGGKTAMLAQQMNNRGAIFACDRDPARLTILQENLSRLGVAIATVHKRDWTQSTRQLDAGTFDRILLDAPCSNTGVMRRRVDVRWRLRANDFVRMAERQLAMARRVIPLLNPGGVLVYSTCSLEPEENEQVVARLLREFPHLRLIEQRTMTPFTDGFDGAFAAKIANNH